MYGIFIQLGQTVDGYSVLVYTLADQYCCSATLRKPAPTVVNFSSRMTSPGLRYVSVRRHISTPCSLRN